MFSEKPEFSIAIPSQTQLLKMVVEITRHIATLYNFRPADAQKISLAVDEAITNAIKHSYDNREDQDISVEYFLEAEGLKIRLTYSGTPPDLIDHEINLCSMIKNKSKGGLGVELIRRIMDSVAYKTVDGINTCEMIKWQKRA